MLTYLGVNEKYLTDYKREVHIRMEKALEHSIDDIAWTSLLFDFYGKLLTKRQRDVMRLYHEENYSLAEIGQEFGISRQGVYSTLKSASNILNSYEEKLHLVNKLMESNHAIHRISTIIENIFVATGDEFVKDKLKEVKDIINRLED